MIVLDASATVELVLDTAVGADVAHRLRGERIAAPAHLDLEVAATIRRLVRRSHMSDRDGVIAVDDYRRLRTRRHPIRRLLDRAYELRATHTVSDGLYIALAEELVVPLVTTDGPLSRSHGHGAVVELIEPS